jgi:hypothetical protein
MSTEIYSEINVHAVDFTDLKTSRQHWALEVPFGGFVQVPLATIANVEGATELLVPLMLRRKGGLGCREVLEHLAEYLSDADNRRELEESICGYREDTEAAAAVASHLTAILQSNEEYLKTRDQ